MTAAEEAAAEIQAMLTEWHMEALNLTPMVRKLLTAAYLRGKCKAYEHAENIIQPLCTKQG